MAVGGVGGRVGESGGGEGEGEEGRGCKGKVRKVGSSLPPNVAINGH